MRLFSETLSAGFMPRLLSGMAVNLEIAGIALAVGLVLGVLLAFGRLGPSAVKGPTILVLGVMRAAPTFVVMFFLLNVIPDDAAVFGVSTPGDNRLFTVPKLVRQQHVGRIQR